METFAYTSIWPSFSAMANNALASKPAVATPSTVLVAPASAASNCAANWANVVLPLAAAVVTVTEYLAFW